MLAVTATAHRARVQPFGPELTHKEYLTPSVENHSGSFFTGSSVHPEQVALDFVEQQLSLTGADYLVKNAYTSKHNGVTHVYLRSVRTI
jgi:extracellular elastinolytic metalloproteinase